MNKYVSQTYYKLRREIMYSPLRDDAEICDNSPKQFSTPTTGSTFWRSSRRLFKSTRSLKINKKESNVGPKKGKLRNLLDGIQTKIQTWSTEIKNNFQRESTECKTPNCVTPNRKIRYMLGRTPEKLYSPFAIETPPSFKWHKFHEASDERIANFYGWLTPPKRNYKSKKL